MLEAPNRKLNLMMIGLAALNFSPHISEHAAFTLLLSTVCLTWRLMYEYQKVRLPILPVKIFLVLSSFFIVYRVYGTLLGVEAATALLIGAVALKFIDSVSYRDAMVVLFLNFLLLMAKFLVSQTLTMTLFAVFNLVVITALLFQLHKGKEVRFDIKTLIRNGIKLTLRTAPLLILLFFVFPRFSTGFVALNEKKEARTGFSGELEPGEVSKLIKSNEMAFRVRFDDFIPGQESMYWRGEVLGTNLGMKWVKEDFNGGTHRGFALNKGELVGHEITLEPRYGKWIFALDVPSVIKFSDYKKQVGIKKNDWGVFRAKNDSGQVLLYNAYSRLDGSELGELKRKKYFLAGVDNTTEKLKELVSSLTKNKKSTQDKVDGLLSHFQNNFRYTLEPGRLRTNTVDEFVFDHKEGFCEHFAAAFAYMARMAGIPSRVVLGFQGGKPNELLGGYYIVKETEAHAWTEVWYEEKRSWKRVDPTEVVAPMRLTLGGEIFYSLPEDTWASGMNKEEMKAMYSSTWFQKYFGKVELYIDFVALQWNIFLLKFDKDGQRDFFKRLGLDFLNSKWLGGLTAALMVLFFLYYRYRANRSRKKTDYQVGLLNQIENKLVVVGYTRAPYEGQSDFINRVNSELQLEVLEEFRQHYINSRFGENELDDIAKKRLKNLRDDILIQLKNRTDLAKSASSEADKTS